MNRRVSKRTMEQFYMQLLVWIIWFISFFLSSSVTRRKDNFLNFMIKIQSLKRTSAISTLKIIITIYIYQIFIIKLKVIFLEYYPLKRTLDLIIQNMKKILLLQEVTSVVAEYVELANIITFFIHSLEYYHSEMNDFRCKQINCFGNYFSIFNLLKSHQN